MLARKSTPTNISPFNHKGLEEQQNHTPQRSPETNKGRTFRRAGNACEIVAGACLNSAVVFTFHLLQVHPAGMVLAVGTAHFYFTATSAGERDVSNLMTGFSASLALLCALSEPMGEWWEASASKTTAQSELQQMYIPPTPAPKYPSWLNGVIIAVFFFALRLALTPRSRNGIFK